MDPGTEPSRFSPPAWPPATASSSPARLRSPDDRVGQTTPLDVPDQVFGFLAELFTGPPGAELYDRRRPRRVRRASGRPRRDLLSSGLLFAVTVSDPAVRPEQHWDALFQENFSLSLPQTWCSTSARPSPTSPPAIILPLHRDALPQARHHRLRGRRLLPGLLVRRAQMAVFVLDQVRRSLVPPPARGRSFTDVPCTGGPFDPWIEELADFQHHRRLRRRQLLPEQLGDA